jgi:hypothetical protein
VLINIEVFTVKESIKHPLDGKTLTVLTRLFTITILRPTVGTGSVTPPPTTPLVIITISVVIGPWPCALVPAVNAALVEYVGAFNSGAVSTTNVVPVPVCDAIDVAFPDEVITPVRLALVVTLLAVKAVAVPVIFVPTRAVGVPRAGVTRIGFVALAKTPVPVPVYSAKVEW